MQSFCHVAWEYTMLADLLNRIDANQSIINACRPFENAGLVKEIRDFYRIGIVYSSNAIEGYSYTLSETKILIEDGLTAGGKPLRDAFAVTGLAKAYDYMFSLLHGSGLTEKDLLAMHGMLSNSLENNAKAGAYRDKHVFVTGSRYPVCQPDEIAAHMDALFTRERMTRQDEHPVVHAARFHKDLVFIHPFADGNGRVSRLAMNILFIQNGYLPVVISPVLRHEYMECLEKAQRNDNDFVIFIARSVIETQKDLLRLLRGMPSDRQDA